MKSKPILTTVFLLVTLFSFAQDFQGVATYKSHRKVDLKVNDEDENSEVKKQIQEQLRKQFQQEYTLTFDKNQSHYKKNEKLEAPAPSSGGIQITVSDGSDIIYRNIQENRYTNKTEIYGKQFLITDSLTKRDWELTNETKNIGEYTCYKAVFKDVYTTQTFADDSQSLETITKERNITAWYTPQIPVAHGPAEYYGLPGLILEINDGELTLICNKIVLNPDQEINIIEPKKGKEVTQKKFDEIMDKKSQEMMEQYRSKRGDGERVIMIGG